MAQSAQAQRVVYPTPTWWRQFANLPGIAASGRSNQRIDIAENVHAIQFRFTAANGTALTRAQLINDISTICIRVNGTPIIDPIPPTVLLDLYKYYNDNQGGALSAPLGIIECRFTRRSLPSFHWDRLFAVGMIGNNGGRNELTYDIVYTAGLVTASIGEVHVEYDLYPAETAGLYVALKSYPKSEITGAATFKIDTLPKNHKGQIAYHLTGSTPGATSYVTVQKGAKLVMQSTHTDVLQIRAREAGRVWQSNYVHIDFGLSNDINGYEALGPAAPSWSIQPTCTSTMAGTAIFYSEEIHDANVEGL